MKTLKSLIKQLYLFELEARDIMQQNEQIMQELFEGTIEIMPTETEEQAREKQILQDKWRHYKFPDFLPEIFNQLIGFRNYFLVEGRINKRSFLVRRRINRRSLLFTSCK